MTQNELKKHFQESLNMFQGTHAEAIKTTLRLLEHIEQLQNQYREYGTARGGWYWKSQKDALDELEKAYEED